MEWNTISANLFDMSLPSHAAYDAANFGPRLLSLSIRSETQQMVSPNVLGRIELFDLASAHVIMVLCGAEGFMYAPRSAELSKALGFPVDVRLMCDCKDSSIMFLKEAFGTRFPRTHLFEEVDHVTAGAGWCHFHNKHCVVSTDDTRVDLALLGPSCQPHSEFRSDRGVVPPHKHPLFSAVFPNSMEYLRAVRPRVAILEQVMGFSKKLPEGEDDEGVPLPYSWLVKFIEGAEELNYKVLCMKLENDIWTEARRSRLPTDE
jgi:hypothetical protein